MERRLLSEMPFDKAFDTGNGRESCHATGFEVLLGGEWWNQYQDKEGEYYYGR